MALIAVRFGWLDDLLKQDFRPDTYEALQRAERIAHEVRKISEGLGFAVLSAYEATNGVAAKKRASPSPNKMMLKLVKAWEAQPNLLQSQDLTEGGPEGVRLTLSGAQDRNVDLRKLPKIWGRASELLHEKHPERLKPAVFAEAATQLLADAETLRAWLWVHVTFLGNGQAYACQLGMLGKDGFFATMTKVAEPPETG